MNDAYAFGQEAEKRAALFYQKQGYTIVAQNFRYRKAEIDLIVRKDNLLVAVEVKARSSIAFGAPYSFISSKKIKLLVMAMDAYIQKRQLDVEVRFDVLSYTLIRGKWQLEQLKDAFYPF